MRKTLLATAAMATISLAISFGGIAAAQNESGRGASGAASGAMQKGTGPSGASQGGKTMSPSGGQPSQNMGKENERLGQSPSDQSKGMSRGAQEEKSGAGPKGAQEKGAQEERGMKERGAQEEKSGAAQKGAQEERGVKQRGAQEEKPGMENKGAQEERGTKERGAQEERGKTGPGGNERIGQSPGSKGSSVQLSQDQRTRIQAVIGKEHAPRFSGSEHFDMTVSARVPRDVHIAVLPEDIVTIVPEYRGFDYIVVGDSFLIVDRATLEIVAVIPA
jgi:Protein of unknown function (DUF1236)